MLEHLIVGVVCLAVVFVARVRQVRKQQAREELIWRLMAKD